MFSRFLILLSALMFLSCEAQKAPAVQVQELSGSIFGSSYSIKYIGDLNPQQFKNDLDVFFKNFNSEFSTYQSDSTISSLNQAGEQVRLKVTPRFIAMLKLAKRLHEQTDGAFDPTLGPIISAWGFGGKGTPKTPEAGVLDEARKHVGIEKIFWDEAKLEAWKSDALVTLNLNAFAPGWAADLIGEEFLLKGVTNFMVDIGGEILVKGKKGDASWLIGIEEPSEAPGQKLHLALKISNLSIATSGDYRQFFNEAGTRRSHIIDPRTGQPVTHQISSVTVLASSAAEADAWGTALMVLGEAGLPLAEKLGHKIYMLKALGPNKFTSILSSGMQDYLKDHRL